MPDSKICLPNTKIVATIGPATDSPEALESLAHAGMTVARLNTKHADVNWHQERIKRVRQVSKKIKRPLGVLLDLQGPEIRINLLDEKSFKVKFSDPVTFLSEKEDPLPNSPMIPQVVIDALSVGDHILIDDGLGEFEVVEKKPHKIITRALGNFVVSHRKTLNTPGVNIPLPSMINQDLKHLDAVAKNNNPVDFIGLSFVRNAHDIKQLKKEMVERGIEADIIAKIENQSAIDHLDEIIAEADAIMVARGDLAVEVPFQELTHWQKVIITKSRLAAKPVITATQMLKSMVENPRPTRAEVSDVAHAIYDGTDAVMLSEETTIGKFPVEAVAAQASIASFNEPYVQLKPLKPKHDNFGDYVTHAAVELVERSKKEGLKIDKIVALTESGCTAQAISRLRPKTPIYVLTSNLRTFYKLSLSYGAIPHVIQLPQGNKLESSTKLIEKMKQLEIVKPGDTIILVHGTFWKEPGLTNTLSILKIR